MSYDLLWNFCHWNVADVCDFSHKMPQAVKRKERWLYFLADVSSLRNHTSMIHAYKWMGLCAVWEMINKIMQGNRPYKIMYTCNRFITTDYNPWYCLMQCIKLCKVDSVWLENLSTPHMFQIQTWDDQGIHFSCKWRQVKFLLPGAKVNGELPCPCMSHTHRLPLLKLSTNLFIAKSNKGWQMIHAVSRAAITTLANPWWRRKMTTTRIWRL